MRPAHGERIIAEEACRGAFRGPFRARPQLYSTARKQYIRPDEALCSLLRHSCGSVALSPVEPPPVPEPDLPDPPDPAPEPMPGAAASCAVSLHVSRVRHSERRCESDEALARGLAALPLPCEPVWVLCGYGYGYGYGYVCSGPAPGRVGSVVCGS